jgi:hypothetical protein
VPRVKPATCNDGTRKGEQGMSSDNAGRSSREPGRPQKQLHPEEGPLPALAQALRDLREACGYPAYRTLQKYAGISHQRLAEAARGERLPAWPVVEGYVHGCWAYHQHKNQPPLDSTGDLTPWQQLYRDAGGALPENQRISIDGEPAPIPPQVGAAAIGKAELARSPLVRIRHVLTSGSFLNRRHLVVGACVVGITLMIGGVIVGMTIGSGRPFPSTKSPTEQSAGILVPAPAPACGRTASDGFRSPATPAFSNIMTVYTVSLEGLSADVMTGTYNGISYHWVQAHPTGSTAGMQLRWSNMPGEWYYCTVTLEAGNSSTLPDLVATMAVPAAVNGRHVIYQACIWHQRPYTARCSPLGI